MWKAVDEERLASLSVPFANISSENVVAKIDKKVEIRGIDELKYENFVDVA